MFRCVKISCKSCGKNGECISEGCPHEGCGNCLNYGLGEFMCDGCELGDVGQFGEPFEDEAAW